MHPTLESYKLIAEHAADAIFVVDTGGRISYANPAAEKAFGYTEREFAGAVLHDMIHHHHPDGRPCERAESRLFHSHTESSAVHDRVTTFIAKDRSLVTMSCTSSPINIDGRPAGSIIFGRDLADRIATEKLLSQSEQRFRLITESMPQIVWAVGPDGSIDYVNARFQQYTGIGLDPGQDLCACVHPDDAARTSTAFSEARSSGGEYQVEHRIRAQDGSYRWFLTRGVPLRGADDGMIGWYGSSTDIDEMRRAADALRDSRETLRLATEATNLGLWDVYPQTGEITWDEANRRLYGIPPDAVLTHELILERIHPADRKRIDEHVRESMQSGRRFHVEFRIIRLNDGGERWMSANGQAVRDEAGQLVRLIGTTLDITDRKLAERRIREAAQRDPLTGLPNRALLFEYCEHLLAVAQRTKGSGALLFIDLDRFKPINDTHGHDIGDQVLKQVAKRLIGCTRKEDIVGRLGGDEFLVAIPHPDGVHGPATVAQNISARISEPYHIANLQLHLSSSIGISLYPRHATTLDALIKCADTAMYAAKKAGRKRYKFYVPSLEEDIHDPHLLIEMRLKQALENNELALHYQPVMELESGRVIGVEALLRLPMPEGEPLVPEQFLHIAEAAGLLHPLGEWVAREACQQHERWRHAGLPKMSMAINVAPQQFRHRSFVAHLANNLQRSGMDPGCLQIELKESTVIEDVRDTIAALEKIRAVGIRVALDDFGVGYSNVSLLSSLPLDKLKIDQSFVRRIGEDAQSQTVTDTILALGKSLNLQVVGEGIESEAEFDYLRGQGCDQAQGYYFSKPLAADEFERWYRSTHLQSHSLH